MSNDYNTIIDFGSSKIRIGVFDKKNINKVFYLEKNCQSNFRIKEFNINQSREIIYQLIVPIFYTNWLYIPGTGGIQKILYSKFFKHLNFSHLRKKDNLS